MKATINSTLLNRLQAKEKPYDVRDDKITGFIVRVNISGKMVYMCEYARGKRISIGTASVLTPAQARDKALEILNNHAKGIDPKEDKRKPSTLTLKDFIQNEYAPWVIQHRRVGNKTLDHIERCFFEPFGTKALKELTPAIFDQWRTQRLKDGVTTETANRDIATLKAAVSKAVLWGFIETHPLERLKLLKADRSVKIRFLSVSEEQNLRVAAINRENRIKEERVRANQWRQERNYELHSDLNEFEFADHLRPMILLSINTGLRRGEVFNLRWNNINFDLATLTIEGSYAKSGKTRHVPLNSEALNTLKRWREQTNDSPLVFPGRFGNRFNTIKKSWLALLKEAKIENFRWHDLRHHFASKLVMADVDLNTVRELLGHSDMSMTLRYAHLAPEHKANAVEKLVKNHSTIKTT